MRRPEQDLVAIVSSLAALTLLHCGGDPADEPASASGDTAGADSAPVDGGPAGASPTGERAGRFEALIEQELQRLRSIEGREGILAEERRYSLYDEELIIRDFFQDRRGGFFVDVGCAWPIRANNTFYLEKHLGWTGIGIDALAEYGPAWKEKRPGSRFFAFFVTDVSDEEALFYRSPDLGLSSADPNLASGRIYDAGLEPEAVKVPAISLNDLLDREGIEKIDLLAMDIEGHEPIALAGFDIERFQPDLVVVERPINRDGEERGPIRRYFDAHGYELIEKYEEYDSSNGYYRRRGS